MKSEEAMSKLGTEKINKLMLTMGIPMILSMVLQAVYNIVDSAFVSNMRENGEMALNALTLAFPIQMLMVAVGVGTGVGVNALLAKSLGQGNQKKACKVAGNSMFLGAVLYVVFLIFGFVGVHGYICSQTRNPLVIDMASDYLGICCVFSLGIIFFSISEKLLQATGRSHLSTIAQISGALTNIVLDPIFIYGWGVPEMGARGAAIATVIGQIVSMVVAIFFHLKYNKEIENGLRYMKPDGKVIKEIYSIGLPAIIAQALMVVMTYGLNIILGRVSESAVTAYGLYYKIQQFLLFAAFGLRDVITPVVSFNHGMGSKKRVKEGIKCGMLYTLIIMAVGLIVLEIFAAPFASIFGLSGETEALCVSAIHIISISFVFAGMNVAFQGVFQALDSGVESLVLSVCRQFLFVLPVAWFLSLPAFHAPEKIWYVWLTFPIAEVVTAIIGCGFMKKIKRNKIDVLEG